MTTNRPLHTLVGERVKTPGGVGRLRGIEPQRDSWSFRRNYPRVWAIVELDNGRLAHVPPENIEELQHV